MAAPLGQSFLLYFLNVDLTFNSKKLSNSFFKKCQERHHHLDRFSLVLSNMKFRAKSVVYVRRVAFLIYTDLFPATGTFFQGFLASKVKDL